MLCCMLCLQHKLLFATTIATQWIHSFDSASVYIKRHYVPACINFLEYKLCDVDLLTMFVNQIATTIPQYLVLSQFE